MMRPILLHGKFLWNFLCNKILNEDAQLRAWNKSCAIQKVESRECAKHTFDLLAPMKWSIICILCVLYSENDGQKHNGMKKNVQNDQNIKFILVNYTIYL